MAKKRECCGPMVSPSSETGSWPPQSPRTRSSSPPLWPRVLVPPERVARERDDDDQKERYHTDDPVELPRIL